MPNAQEITTKWTQPLVDAAGSLYNKVFGFLPFCIPNDAKFRVDLGDLKYSQKELLRLASQSRSFDERAESVTDYLVACNPHLKESVGRMNMITKRLFFNQLSDDQQFEWCLKKYSGIDISDTHMQPGVRGLHLANSVSDDIYRKKVLTSPLGAILIFIISMRSRGGGGASPPSERDLMNQAPSLNPNRPPIMDAAALGLGSGAANTVLHSFFYGTHESFQRYAEQHGEDQGKRAAKILQAQVDELVSQHTNGVTVPRQGNPKSKGLIQCLSTEPDHKPSADTSEVLRKIEYGETGCQSICGTQSSTAVETCLDKTLNPGYDDKDNLQCQALGPFKSKDAVRADYLDQARTGTYYQERRWRQDQKSEDIFQGQCKEPSEGNFNPYPGTKVDVVEVGVDGRPGLHFKSEGKDFNGRGSLQKGCTLNTFPNPLPEVTEFPEEIEGPLKCSDSPEDLKYQPNQPNIDSLTDQELKAMLGHLHEALATKGCEDF